MVYFPTRIAVCDSHSPALLGLFLLPLVFALQWLSLHWEILIVLLSQFPLTFHQTQNRMPHFITYDYSCADWDSLHNHFRGVSWEDIFELRASAAASEF